MTGFLSTLHVELIDHKNGGLWRVTKQFEFEDSNGTIWKVPEGYKTDFASVPRIPIAYWLFGNTAHAPAVLHDWLISENITTRKRADQLFEEAMEAAGMPLWRSKPMFKAVRAYAETLAKWFE